MKKGLRLDKVLIEERMLPISGYNYYAIKELPLKIGIKVSVPTIIARVTSYITDKGQVTIRSSGLYANVHREKIKKAILVASTIRIVEDKLRHILSRGRAEMICKVYEVEQLLF